MRWPSGLKRRTGPAPRVSRRTRGCPVPSALHTLDRAVSAAVTMRWPSGLIGGRVERLAAGPWSVTSRKFDSRASRASASQSSTPLRMFDLEEQLDRQRGLAALQLLPRSRHHGLIRARPPAASPRAGMQARESRRAAPPPPRRHHATMAQLAPVGALPAERLLRLSRSRSRLSSNTFLASQSCPSSKYRLPWCSSARSTAASPGCPAPAPPSSLSAASACRSVSSVRLPSWATRCSSSSRQRIRPQGPQPLQRRLQVAVQDGLGLHRPGHASPAAAPPRAPGRRSARTRPGPPPRPSADCPGIRTWSISSASPSRSTAARARPRPPAGTPPPPSPSP